MFVQPVHYLHVLTCKHLYRSLTRKLSQASLTSTRSTKSFDPSPSNADQSTSSPNSTVAQDLRETTHYVKQSLLDAKVICCLAPWIMCGIYEIQVYNYRGLKLRFISNISNTRDSVSSGYPNTEKRVGNTTPHLCLGLNASIV